MILTVSVMVMVTVLAGVGSALATRDMKGAGQAQQAGIALDVAEAGIAQAITYIRRSGTRKLSCYPATCTTNPWNPTTPVSVEVKGGRWTAWIAPESIGNGDDGDRYVIRSTGTASGPAERTIEVEVTVAPIDLPKGIFGRTINLGGTVDLEQISIFTTGCVYKRDKVTSNYAAGLDAAYGVPIGVHSSQIITESQGSGQYCSNTSKPIHGGLNLAGLSLKPCNSAYPYDQDRFGGSLTALPLVGGLLSLVPCSAVSALPTYTPRDIDLNGTLDVNGSFLRDDQALFRSFGITRPALTDAQIEQLKITAQAQGTYYTSPNGWTVPDGTVSSHTVLFFDLSSTQTVDLKPLDGSLWSRTRITSAANPLCIDASLVVLVKGGNAQLNGDSPLAASVYLSGAAPGGQLFKANGTADHIGMLYADTLDFAGNLGVSLDACFVANPPPSLFDLTTGAYRELDR
ncbi:MAG: hypothetical protein ACT4QF_17450 [Sporichthyaceae bacterium]